MKKGVMWQMLYGKVKRYKYSPATKKDFLDMMDAIRKKV